MAVKPCIVTFTLLQLQPVGVTVKAPKKDNITESDDCSSKGIAVISGGDTKYTVTPGLLGGTCTAVFTGKPDGKKHHKDKGGSATLTIHNYN